MEIAVDLYALVQAAGDAIIVADVEGRIVLWNPAAERLFGFTATEAVGSLLDLIIPARFRERHWREYYTVMQNGETRYGSQGLREPAPKTRLPQRGPSGGNPPPGWATRPRR